jgi:hypothetical protein
LEENFGILILSAIVTILPVVAAGLEEAGGGRREGMDTEREGFREGAERDVRDAMKLERIRVMEEQRWAKPERGRRCPSECGPEGGGRKSRAEGLDFAAREDQPCEKGRQREHPYVNPCVMEMPMIMKPKLDMIMAIYV